MNSLEEGILNIKNSVIEDIYKANVVAINHIGLHRINRFKAMLAFLSLRKHFRLLFLPNDNIFDDIGKSIKIVHGHQKALYLQSQDDWCNAAFNFSAVKQTFESSVLEIPNTLIDRLVFGNILPKEDFVIEFQFDIVKKNKLLQSMSDSLFLNKKSLVEQKKLSSDGSVKLFLEKFSEEGIVEDSLSNIFSMKTENDHLMKLLNNLYERRSFFDFLMLMMYRDSIPKREDILKQYSNYQYIRKWASTDTITKFCDHDSDNGHFYFNFNLKEDEARSEFVKDIFQLTKLRFAKISGESRGREYSKENIAAEYMTNSEYLSLKFDIEDLQKNIDDSLKILNEKKIRFKEIEKEKSTSISGKSKRIALKETGYSEHKFRKIKEKIPLLNNKE